MFYGYPSNSQIANDSYNENEIFCYVNLFVFTFFAKSLPGSNNST